MVTSSWSLTSSLTSLRVTQGSRLDAAVQKTRRVTHNMPKLSGVPHPSSSECLCAKEMMSEARPLPSHTTTGMGGSSLRLSRAMEITLGPPSTIRHTTGTPWPRPAHVQKDTESSPCPSIPRCTTCTHHPTTHPSIHPSSQPSIYTYPHPGAITSHSLTD